MPRPCRLTAQDESHVPSEHCPTSVALPPHGFCPAGPWATAPPRAQTSLALGETEEGQERGTCADERTPSSREPVIQSHPPCYLLYLQLVFAQEASEASTPSREMSLGLSVPPNLCIHRSSSWMPTLCHICKGLT